MGRARSACGCHADGTAGRLRHRRRGADSCVPFGYWSKEALLVQLGENAAPLLVDGRVGSQAEQRDCRPLRLGDAGQDIGRTTTTWTLTDTDPTADTGVDVGHKRCRSLIPCHDVLDPASGVTKGVVKRHSSVPRKTEHMLNP